MSRIPAMLTDEGYKHANEAFQNYWSGDHDELLEFITTHAPTDKDGEPLTVLSIGAGDGGRDAQALEALHEGTGASGIYYTAVEPNADQINALKTVLEDHPALAGLVTEQTTAEKYAFPANTFDVILFTHSLYHMPGAEKALLQKAVAALKPGGCIIIALSTESGGIFQMMGAFWNTIDYSHFEQGDGLFGQEALLKILEEDYAGQFQFEALPHVFIDMAPVVEEDGDDATHLLNFVMQSDTTKLPDDVLANIKATLKEMAPLAEDESYRLPHGSGVAVILKD